MEGMGRGAGALFFCSLFSLSGLAEHFVASLLDNVSQIRETCSITTTTGAP